MNRGSEWRRWELHLHTPFTKKADQYTGKTTDEKWDNFYTSIADYIGNGSDPLRSICAIAITDYLSIDNYLKVCADKRLPDSVKLVFPNVELRMTPIASDSPINIHCLFDPSIVGELEGRFFANLKFEYNHNKYSATKSELIRLGHDFQRDQSLNDEEALKIGLSQYVISLETLSDVFKYNPQLKEKTIVVVSNSSSDGASGLRTHSDYFLGDISQLEATRRAIYQLSDMVFSSNPKDIAYFLGEGPDSIDVVKEKCGSLMPCIHGCDAHSNEKVFAPTDNRFCWIKADPTFEGLKQVLYEPKERVRISSSVPDEKPGYYVIDRVEIAGNADFSPEPIYFSDQLTCIIGGKSTGKSLLLHNMATAIDRKQVEKKQETAATNVKQIPELKVYWRDGVCSDDKSKERKIVYIPQTYLNRLSDEEQETTEIDTIIQDIVLQDQKCNEAYRLMLKKISEQKQQIAKSIVDFLQIVKNREELYEQCKGIGDKEAIEAELTKLNDQLEQLSKEYNVTETEIEEYQSSIENARTLKESYSVATKEIEQIQDIQSVVDMKFSPNSAFVVFNELFDNAIDEVKKIADEAWATKREEILQAARKKCEDIESAISKHEERIAILKPKMDGNERISKLSASIVKERERLAKLSEYQTQLSTVQAQYKQNLNELSQSFSTFSQIYLAYVDSINSGFVSSTDELEFSVRKVLRIDQLMRKISELLDNRSIGRFHAFNLREITEDILSSEHIEAFIEAILANSKDSLQLKGGYTVESALREILSDWYNIDYVVRMDNDNIQDMSPGKKALVLLRLLISLAESRCPILIDQPEDDLDNRSIFDELIRFIKEKKVDRQIITVTHNANIVLGGDAELVIVANQQGKNAPNKKYRFEYRGGSIEDNNPVVEENGEAIPGILNSKGIQEHICEILEGGEQAFALRQHKYHFIKN
ncbi:TrlF family AAA-like ATPase [Clostridium sp. M62/1]|uniref:TrlF family AAA-like ATPase n=1 Tax=Clostridium sp. M62/1 TaxID=411486 RepID=UPI0035699A5E